MVQQLIHTDLPLPNRRAGKVRDVYDLTLPDGRPGVLMVATDRISAFDVIMTNGITGRGIVLTQLSKFWFDRFSDLVDHHLVSTDAADIPAIDDDQRSALDRRVKICRKTRVIPIECVVRGYLAGSAWKEYQDTQSVCGVELPAGLRQCEQLPEPIFTPATKAESGHDLNISFADACQRVGRPIMEQLRMLSLQIYAQARNYAAQHGIIIADTKFEFGLPLDGTSDNPILIDEILTPDSSRFWPAEQYEVGRDQESFDKQYVRNYLQGLCDRGEWNKTPPGPMLPGKIVANTIRKYLAAYKLLTGHELTL